MTDQPKAFLEMTAADHFKVGSTPPKALTDNPGMQLHETMDEEQLLNYIARQIMMLILQQQRAIYSEDPFQAQMLKQKLERYLIPDVAYLKEIGRIPGDLDEFDPTVAFPLPGDANEGTGVVLPGNSTLSDLVEIMKMAASVIRNPDGFSLSDKAGCAFSLDMFVEGVS